MMINTHLTTCHEGFSRDSKTNKFCKLSLDKIKHLSWREAGQAIYKCNQGVELRFTNRRLQRGQSRLELRISTSSVAWLSGFP